jgi:hypothetical protein
MVWMGNSVRTTPRLRLHRDEWPRAGRDRGEPRNDPAPTLRFPTEAVRRLGRHEEVAREGAADIVCEIERTLEFVQQKVSSLREDVGRAYRLVFPRDDGGPRPSAA